MKKVHIINIFERQNYTYVNIHEYVCIYVLNIDRYM